MHRSSSKQYWFVWPELSNDVPHISWVNESERNASWSDIHSKLTLNVENTGLCDFYTLWQYATFFAMRDSP